MKVTAAHENLVDIAIPLALLEQALEGGDPGFLFQNITSIEHIQRVRLPRAALQDAGTIEGQGVGVIAAPTWQQAGITGQGIKIGILDMGFNKYRDLLGDELPAQVVAQSFIAGVEIDDSSTEHGTAVAEIIHDIAPDAELFFAAYETDAEMGQAVSWLISQQVQIISHSAGSLFGPMDGSSYEAGLVDDAFSRGILWVNSAGNSADTHYRGVFTDSDGDGYHEFRAGDESMDIRVDGRVTLVLNWDAWDTGNQDYDLYINNDQGNEIASSVNIQSRPGDEAAEYITYSFSDDGPYYVSFYASNTTRSVVFDFYVYNAEIEYYTLEDSITTPADARGALTVGATYWQNDELEIYSSRGPTRDGRLKPEISAPTGVRSAAYGESFYGTSASAPHVAGAAALVWQAQPQYSPTQVRDFLLSRAIDLEESGPDNDTGYGRLYLGEPTFSSPPTPQPTSPAATPTAPPSPTPLPTTTLASSAIPTAAINPVSTPPAQTLNASMLWFPMLACVLLPGMLGLAGLGMLGSMIYLRSSRSEPHEGSSVGRPIYPIGARQPMHPNPALQPAPRPAAPLPLAIPPPPARPPQSVAGGVCPRCANSHRPQARFCPVCGYGLQSPAAAAAAPSSMESKPLFCVHCGSRMYSTSRFCPQCGKPRRPAPPG